MTPTVRHGRLIASEFSTPARRGVVRNDPACPCRYLPGSPPPKRTIAGLAPWQQRAAKKLLCENVADPLDITDIAEKIGVSRGHFIGAFAQSTGATPHQWLIDQRLRWARKLMLSTELSLAEIALACGFYDQSHFNRTFARSLGTSPGRWRRRFRLVGPSPILPAGG